MRIRNTRDVRLVVPSLHLETDPDGEERVPADTPIPDGFERVDDPAPASKRAKAKNEPQAATADTDEKETDQ